MHRPSSVPLTLLLALALAACGGGDSPVAPGGDGGGPGGSGSPGGDSPKADPSFASDIVPIFTRLGCTAGGCHGAPVQAGLNLASSPYTNLVSVASTQTGELRVIPGNANDSYLVKKLEGRASQGERMPVGGQIGATDLANIKNWINQGAKNN
ncbi:MAG: hypothetical protein AMXMBFR53_28510 [Gemmatimonadota bacterium]